MGAAHVSGPDRRCVRGARRVEKTRTLSDARVRLRDAVVYDTVFPRVPADVATGDSGVSAGAGRPLSDAASLPRTRNARAAKPGPRRDTQSDNAWTGLRTSMADYSAAWSVHG